MITIIVLFGSFATLILLARLGIFFRHNSTRDLAAYAMSIFLVFVGISHFFLYDELLLMIPKFLPYPGFIVYLTGVIEIILAIGFISRRTRKLAGIITVLYFIAVFPANVVKAMSNIEIKGAFNSPVMSWIRLSFQPVFIVWALYCSKSDQK